MNLKLEGSKVLEENATRRKRTIGRPRPRIRCWPHGNFPVCSLPWNSMLLFLLDRPLPPLVYPLVPHLVAYPGE